MPSGNKVYDLVKLLLVRFPALRNSDRQLLWAFWKEEGAVVDNVMTQDGFVKSTPAESITRARRMVQQDHPELGATESVRNARATKRESKGTFVYREGLKQYDKDRGFKRRF